MRKIIPLLFLTACGGQASAQTSDPLYAVTLQFVRQPDNYLQPLDTLLSLRPHVANNAAKRSYFYNEAAHFSSYIGEYRAALRYHDSTGVRRPIPASPATGAAAFSGYQPASAARTIVRLAASHQVTMLNEAHHIPYHRLFTKSLLQELYDAGYRYLALETLAPFDDALNNRRYPVGKDGFYSVEPLFADMIRTALRTGYRLVSYEAQSPCNGSREECIAQREQEQAANLQQLLQKDPAAKILVHVGYSHLRELPLQGTEWMAARFKKMTGIDPLTINQELMRETFDPALQHPAYTTALQLFTWEEPAVFMKAGNLWNLEPAPNTFDVIVFHPPYGSDHGRPGYYRLDAARKPVHVRLRQARRHVLVQAFVTAETDPGRLPVDQLLLENGQAAQLMLPPGAYDIIVRDAKGNILETQPLTTP